MEWTQITLAEDGALAWGVELKGTTSAPRRVTGAPITVAITGGPVDVLGSLDGQTFYPLNDLQGISLTHRRDCLEGIAERVYAVQVRGTGTVTLFAVRGR